MEALQDDWNDLERRTPEATGFQSFQWCRAWVRTCARFNPPPLEPRVLVVRENGRAVWLLPLQIERRFGVRWARCLGQPLTQYADALAETNQSRTRWRAIADAELCGWNDVDTVSMIQVRADSVLAKVRGRSYVTATAGSAPYLRLTNPVAVRKALTVRRDLRRRLRGLAQHGPIILDPPIGRDLCRSRLREALDLKATWMRSRGIPYSTLFEPLARQFLEELASTGELVVHRLLVGSRTAAADIGLVASGTYRSLMSAYSLDLSAGAPGHVLTRLLIERLEGLGFHEFDLLAPAEPYKASIANRAMRLVSVHHSLTMRGYVGTAASLNLRRPWQFVKDWRGRS